MEFEWIEVDKAHPRIHAEVLFVVRSKNPAYHGHIMVGRYCGDRLGYHGFSIPGIEFEGSHWGILPEPPAPCEECQYDYASIACSTCGVWLLNKQRQAS